MVPIPLAALILVLLLALLFVQLCEADLKETARRLSDVADAKKRGSHKASLQYPHIDLRRCLGCGTCVKSCPEEGVLDLIHGQSAVVHGSRCVGHGLCAKECPVDAIDVTLGDLKGRTDIPALTEQLEAIGSPGLFLAGEVTGYALIRTAVLHGRLVADEVAHRIASTCERRRRASPSGSDGLLDLCIVGAGPAGLSAALQAKSRGLNILVLEQESIGGTVAKYPRRKLVMTQPVALPGYGRLKRTSYRKEELMELWERLASEHQLPIESEVEYRGLQKTPEGHFLVRTSRGDHRARFVCLALGRRGTPRKLGVPGEHLPKVAYSLIDAQSYQARRIVVVGGGDSAVEAALGLAEQPGNQVTLSYRKPAIFRIKARNEQRLKNALEKKKVDCIFESEVSRITQDAAHLRVGRNSNHGPERILANDDVFIMAGGSPPFPLLKESGVSFDLSQRAAGPSWADRGAGLTKALAAALVLALLAVAWVSVFSEYYALPRVARPESPLHALLRPSGPVGLACGLLATALILANLGYLVRRSWLGGWIPGSLRAWMTCHLVTGTLVLLLLLVHAAMSPQNTLGGHAYWAVAVLLATGAVGRYFYSLVPRVASGKEVELEQLQERLAAESQEWDRCGREFGDRVRREVAALAAVGKWRRDFFMRMFALVRTQRRVRESLRRLRRTANQQGLAPDQTHRLIALAKRSHRTALVAAHHEDLRALLASWRFFHRWIALLMVLLAAAHILTALRYGDLVFTP